MATMLSYLKTFNITPFNIKISEVITQLIGTAWALLQRKHTAELFKYSAEHFKLSTELLIFT